MGRDIGESVWDFDADSAWKADLPPFPKKGVNRKLDLLREYGDQMGSKKLLRYIEQSREEGNTEALALAIQLFQASPSNRNTVICTDTRGEI